MDTTRQDELYLRAAAEYGSALARLARAYEVDSSQRLDLLQDMHFALWHSFSGYAGQCLSALFFWVAVTLGFSLAVARLDLRLERLNTLKAE